MFEDSLAVSAASATPQRRWIVAASFTAQAVVVAALIAVPLLHPAVLSRRVFDPPLAMPLIPPPVPPPPTQPVRVHVAETPTTAVAAPATDAPRIPHTDPQPSAPEPPSGDPIVMGNSGNSAPFPFTGVGPGGTSPVISVASGTGVGTGSRGPHSLSKISTGVSAGLLLGPIQPVYPKIAIAAHRGGVVMVEATISTTGKVESAHAISGDPMLQGAAVEAVRSARYRPFLLNGQPTEVAATFTIRFNLNGD